MRAAAARRVAEEQARRAVVTYGLPREVDPAQALLEEVHRTAGHVAWLGALVAELEREKLKQYDVTSKAGQTIRWEKPAVWVEMYQTERRHLAKVAKDAIDAGANERVVRVMEQVGGQIAVVVGRVADALLAAVLALLADVVDRDEAARAAVEAVRLAWPRLVAEIVPRELRAVTGNQRLGEDPDAR